MMESDISLLKMSSYNCKSFGEDKYKIIARLIENNTFVLIQEHWQYEKQFVNNLNNLGKEFKLNTECVVVSPMDENVQRVGRGKGGVAIIWKNNLKCKIDQIKCVSKRMCAIKVTKGEFKFLIFNVYMPTDPGQGNYDLAEYNEVLNEVSEIMISSDTQYGIFGGDWNTDISRFNNQTKTFLSFIREERLSLGLEYQHSDIPFTFNSGESVSTLDHFLVTENLFSSINLYKSLLCPDDFSDHVPVMLNMNIDIEYHAETVRANTASTAWHRCTGDQLLTFKDELDSLLLMINIQHEALTCSDFQCSIHKNAISMLHRQIVNVLLSCDNNLPKTGDSSQTNNTVAGWNEYVKEHKDEAMFRHQIWLDSGRPPQGPIALMRRTTRARYHYAIRFVNKEKTRIKSNRMAEAMINNQDRVLWKEVKKMKQSSKSVPNIIDSVTGSENINRVFKNKFKDIYNSVGYNADQLDKLMSDIDNKINDYSSLVEKKQCVNYKIAVSDVQNAILNIKSNKKEENGLNTNHFKAGSNRLNVILSLLFNSMLSHGLSPEEMNLGTMSPLIKDTRKSQQCSDNYRSLTIGSSISKIFDMILLKKHNSNLSTSYNQFGFKENMSTNMCTFVLNETAAYYVKNGSPVYTLFLDASKAFDRLNFVKLFEKHITKGMCPITVRFLLNMYLSQKI